MTKHGNIMSFPYDIKILKLYAKKNSLFHVNINLQYFSLWNIGQPSPARIAQDGFTMVCIVNSTSEPDHVRPDMVYIWYRNQMKYSNHTKHPYLTRPIEDWGADNDANYSCQAMETGSVFVTNQSRGINYKSAGEPIHIILFG